VFLHTLNAAFTQARISKSVFCTASADIIITLSGISFGEKPACREQSARIVPLNKLLQEREKKTQYTHCGIEMFHFQERHCGLLENSIHFLPLPSDQSANLLSPLSSA
jgi:hypothetical protein